MHSHIRSRLRLLTYHLPLGSNLTQHSRHLYNGNITSFLTRSLQPSIARAGEKKRTISVRNNYVRSPHLFSPANSQLKLGTSCRRSSAVPLVCSLGGIRYLSPYPTLPARSLQLRRAYTGASESFTDYRLPSPAALHKEYPWRCQLKTLLVQAARRLR